MALLHNVEWVTGGATLRAVEPTASQLEEHAAELAASYNEPHNRAMMSNTADMTPAEVVDLYAERNASGGRAFLLFRNGELMGDADFRHVDGEQAEYAILVGPRAAQGKGLGTLFTAMLHVLAYDAWKLRRVCVTIIPQNKASQRLFEKLGYVHDEHARCYAEAPDDVCMAADRAQFEAACKVRGLEIGGVEVVS